MIDANVMYHKWRETVAETLHPLCFIDTDMY